MREFYCADALAGIRDAFDSVRESGGLTESEVTATALIRDISQGSLTPDCRTNAYIDTVVLMSSAGWMN